MTAAVVLLETQAKLLRTPLLVLLVSLACVYGLGIEVLGIPLAVALAIAVAFAGPVLFGAEYSEGAREYLQTRPLSARKVFWTKSVALTLFGLLAAVTLNGALMISRWFAAEQLLTERFLAAIILFVLYLSSAATILTKDTVRGALYGVPTALVLWAIHSSVCERLFSSRIFDLSRGGYTHVFPDQTNLVVLGMLMLTPPVALGVLHWAYRIRATHRVTFPIALVILSIPLAVYTGYSYSILYTEGKTSVHRTEFPIAKTIQGETLLFVKAVSSFGLWSLDLKDPTAIPAPVQVVGGSREGAYPTYYRATFMDNLLILWARERHNTIDVEVLGSGNVSEASYHIEIPQIGWVSSIERVEGDRLYVKAGSNFARSVDPRNGHVEAMELDPRVSHVWQMSDMGRRTNHANEVTTATEEDTRFSIELSLETEPTPGVRWRIREENARNPLAEGIEKGWPYFVEKESRERLLEKRKEEAKKKEALFRFLNLGDAHDSTRTLQLSPPREPMILLQGRRTSRVTWDLAQGKILEATPLLDPLDTYAQWVDGNRRYYFRSLIPSENEWSFDVNNWGPLETLDAKKPIPSATPAIWVSEARKSDGTRVQFDLPLLRGFCADKTLAAGIVPDSRELEWFKSLDWRPFFWEVTKGFDHDLRLYDTSDPGNIRYVTIPIPERLKVLAEAYSTKGGFWKYLADDKYRVANTTVYPSLTLGGGYLCLWASQLRRVAVWSLDDPRSPKFLGLAVIEGDSQRRRMVYPDNGLGGGNPTTPIRRADGALGFFQEDSGLLWLQFPELAKEVKS